MSKSGFVTILGRPNVGKSTLLNRLIHQKIAIVSNTAQTTRETIQGVLTTDKGQIVFVDTPGIHRPMHELGRTINQRAMHAIDGVDVLCVLIPYNEPLGRSDRYILEQISDVKVPVFCLLTKIDKSHNKNVMLETIAKMAQVFSFAEIIPISAQEDDNIDRLVDVLFDYLPEGEPLFSHEVVSTRPEYWWVAEVIREKILHATKEEVPHSVAVVVTAMSETDDGYWQIDADIIVEKKTQKGILIGRQGAMVERIGTLARKELSARFRRHIFLNLYVKHEPDWRNKPHRLLELGYGNDD
jgi:GTP-binding protein Era